MQKEKEKRGREEVGRRKASSKLLGFEGRLVVQAPYLSIFLSRYERRDCSLKECRLVTEKDLAPLVQDYLGFGSASQLFASSGGQVECLGDILEVSFHLMFWNCWDG